MKRHARKRLEPDAADSRERQMLGLGFVRFRDREKTRTEAPLPCFLMGPVGSTGHMRTYARDELGRDWYVSKQVDLKPLGFTQMVSCAQPVDIETAEYAIQHPGSVIYYEPK